MIPTPFASFKVESLVFCDLAANALVSSIQVDMFVASH